MSPPQKDTSPGRSVIDPRLPESSVTPGGYYSDDIHDDIRSDDDYLKHLRQEVITLRQQNILLQSRATELSTEIDLLKSNPVAFLSPRLAFPASSHSHPTYPTGQYPLPTEPSTPMQPARHPPPSQTNTKALPATLAQPTCLGVCTYTGLSIGAGNSHPWQRVRPMKQEIVSSEAHADISTKYNPRFTPELRQHPPPGQLYCSKEGKFVDIDHFDQYLGGSEYHGQCRNHKFQNRSRRSGIPDRKRLARETDTKRESGGSMDGGRAEKRVKR